MEKFKVGDRVRVKYFKTEDYVGIITAVDADENDSRPYQIGGQWYRSLVDTVKSIELESEQKVAQSQYHPITPKVGEKYRVIKDFKDFYFFSHENKGTVCWKRESGDWTSKDGGSQLMDRNYLTTEYLEPVSESKQTLSYTNIPTTLGSITVGSCWGSGGNSLTTTETAPINKQSIITKTMNFIKKLTQSADDKALEKAIFLDSCGELTNTGKAALTSLIFKDKKAELVALANEVIAEAKETL